MSVKRLVGEGNILSWDMMGDQRGKVIKECRKDGV